jgi:hypothetical protein
VSQIKIEKTGFNPLISLDMKLSDEHRHVCIAVASVTVRQPALAGRYEIAIGNETGTFSGISSRKLIFQDRDETNRSDVREITTAYVRDLTPGNHTVSLIGFKNRAEMPDLVLGGGSLFAICMPRNP